MPLAQCNITGTAYKSGSPSNNTGDIAAGVELRIVKGFVPGKLVSLQSVPVYSDSDGNFNFYLPQDAVVWVYSKLFGLDANGPAGVRMKVPVSGTATLETLLTNTLDNYPVEVIPLAVPGGGGGGGGVSSVGLAVPSWLSVSGSPITSSGTITISAATGQAANRVLATPDGTTGALSPRALVANDIPSLPASKITSGAFGVARGGTGLSTIASGKLLGTTALDTVGEITVGSGLQLSGNVLSATGGGGGGSVTSVGMTVPSWLLVTGSPVTSAGTLAVTAAPGQTANLVLASPDGTTGAVTLRALVAADIPTLAYSKLNLSGSIVNADVAAGAAIAYSKLALTGSITGGDIATGAAIPYTKLALTAGIVNSDISNSAAIALSKISISGTPDGSKFLRDDGTWAAAGGSTAIAANQIAYGTGTAITSNAKYFIDTTADRLRFGSSSNTVLGLTLSTEPGFVFGSASNGSPYYLMRGQADPWFILTEEGAGSVANQRAFGFRVNGGSGAIFKVNDNLVTTTNLLSFNLSTNAATFAGQVKAGNFLVGATSPAASSDKVYVEGASGDVSITVKNTGTTASDHPNIQVMNAANTASFTLNNAAHAVLPSTALFSYNSANGFAVSRNSLNPDWIVKSLGDGLSARVGINVTPTLASLQVQSTANDTGATVAVKDTSASGYAALDFYSSGGSSTMGIGYANASAALNPGVNYINANGVDLYFLATATAKAVFKAATGRWGFGTSSPGNFLEIDNTAANTSGLRFTRLTSASPDGTSTAYLAVDANGDVVRAAAPSGGGGGGAPTGATYITQTPDGTLSAEQALSALATGLLKNTTSTGVLTIAVAGTDYVAPGAYTASGLTMATARLLGRSTASTGAAEEISIGSGLSLSGGVLSATGGGSSAWSSLTAPSANLALDVATYTSTFTANDAVTNAITVPWILGHNTSGTAAANFGVGLRFKLESTTTTDQDAGQVAAYWLTATHASRSSAVSVYTVTNGTLAEQIQFADGAITFKAGLTTFVNDYSIVALTSLGRMGFICGTPGGSGFTFHNGGNSQVVGFLTSSGDWRLQSDQQYIFTDSTTNASTGTPDTGLSRLEAGGVRATNGSTGAGWFAVGTSTAYCRLRAGAGSPEGVVAGNVGDLYLRTDGGAASTLYIKESGTGNTGWAAK